MRSWNRTHLCVGDLLYSYDRDIFRSLNFVLIKLGLSSHSPTLIQEIIGELDPR